ncbi:MAG: aldose 1-epimerase [Myxococcota bacterium]
MVCTVAEQTVVLKEPAFGSEATFWVDVGHTCADLRLQGVPVLFCPYTREQYASSDSLAGIPFLHPWANRLSSSCWRFQETFVTLSSQTPCLRDAYNRPLHGLCLKTPAWKLRREPDGPELRLCRLDSGFHSRLLWTPEHPDFEAFPFHHDVEMQVQLHNGLLRITTTVRNLDCKTMPVGFGFHPYFSFAGYKRAQITLSLCAQRMWLLNAELLPTGMSVPIEQFHPTPWALPLQDVELDHLFSVGKGHPEQVAVKRTSQTIGQAATRFGIHFPDAVVWVNFEQGYDFAVLYAPSGQDFVCIEPMTVPSNAFVFAERGDWRPLPTLEPGASYRAVFSIERVPRMYSAD